ncbi:MAG: Fe-S cluster assembly protein SufD [Candidatus Nanopelagicaceae bacterium]
MLNTNIIHTPTGREEAWRFTPLARLKGLHDGSAVIGDAHSLISKDLPKGVTFERISSDNHSTNSDDAIVQRVVGSTSIAKLTIDGELATPVILGRNAIEKAEYSRVQVLVKKFAKATVILENTGNSLIAEDIEIVLEPGSNLTFVTLQEFESDAVYAARHHAIVDKDATFKSITVTIGGSLVRILPTVEFKAPGGDVDLQGVYFASAGQHFEHRLHVDHLVPNAKSRVNYKGVLAGESARTVWFGDVFIRAAAEGTDTYELNRNLLLTDGARADSVPNLEIETGEIVGAGHASTTGRFDDEQLFYLMSRGINIDDARRLVVRGFFNEIIGQIKNEEIENRLMSRIDAELEQVGK